MTVAGKYLLLLLLIREFSFDSGSKVKNHYRKRNSRALRTLLVYRNLLQMDKTAFKNKILLGTKSKCFKNLKSGLHILYM